MQPLCHWAKQRGKLLSRCIAVVAVAAAVVLSCGLPRTASAVPGPLRLSGSFIQYWGEMMTWSPDTWRAVLDRMKQARMNTVIIQMLVIENNDGSLHSFIGPSGQPDATETILDYADTNNFRVFLGLYLPNWNHDMTGSSFLLETQSRMATVAQQAWDRYLAGRRHASFAGWYLPYESWTANYQPAEVDRLRSFFQSIHASCQAVSGDMPLAISPFISASRPSPCRVETLYRQLLDQSGIDIVLLQDSVGAQQWETDIPQRAGPYFQAFQNACQSTGVKLWANLESFRITDSVFGPCDATRLRKQFDAAGLYVEDFVTFDFVHYMNPVAFLSSWDQSRRTQMQQLYADYKAAFADTDYAPYERPALAANVADDTLQLKWQGSPGDLYQLQVKSNLADLAWTPLDSPIQTNGSEFSVAGPILPESAARWYRVQKLPTLQVPESMVWIPPGTFLMGTATNDPNKTPNELTQFPVTLSRGFWINQFEVTQSEYQNLTCSNPSSNPADLECPVDKVTWRNAVDYCALLTQRERQALRLPNDYAYRLPTEAEWEYAARSGTTNAFGFGNDPALLPAYAWYSVNGQSTTHPVGQLQPTAWGLKDIHGNVFEWCWDWISSAPTQPVTDFRGATNDVYHAIRGGASSFPWTYCRAGWRTGYSAASVPTQVGFRIVLAPVNP